MSLLISRSPDYEILDYKILRLRNLLCPQTHCGHAAHHFTVYIRDPRSSSPVRHFYAETSLVTNEIMTGCAASTQRASQPIRFSAALLLPERGGVSWLLPAARDTYAVSRAAVPHSAGASLNWPILTDGTNIANATIKNEIPSIAQNVRC